MIFRVRGIKKLLPLVFFQLFWIIPTSAQSQSVSSNPAGYPDKVVRIIVPFAPGGPSDIIARLLSQKLSENSGKSFIVENKPGGAANIGAAQVAKSAPDGYTLLLMSSAYVINPSLYENPGFHPLKDFAPVALPVSSPNVLVASPDFAAKNFKDFIAFAKANPGKIDYATPGNGTGPHLSMELLKIRSNLDMKHIPYNGGGPALQAVLGHQVPIGFSALPPAMAQINAGKLIPLAITSKVRFTSIPNVPTIGESGFPDFEGDTQQFISAPAGTPKSIVNYLNQEITKIVQEPVMREKLVGLGYIILTPTPEQTTQIIQQEVDKWAKVVKAGNIKPD
jgi:tripartite-type tricarboxylate transporter receptor subunit TctC